MSSTDFWAKKSETHRYSQDDRSKQKKFEKELTEPINKFLDSDQKSMVVGQYDLELEPWRIAAVVSFRKFGLKILEKQLDSGLVELTVVRQKMSKITLG